MLFKRITFRQIALFIACLLYSATSFAQNETDLRLDLIIDDMYKADNSNFIIVQALRDKLIKEKNDFTIAYVNGVVSIDGNKISEPYQSTYKNKIMTFYHERVGSTIISRTGVTLQEILDEKSSFRTHVTTPLDKVCIRPMNKDKQ